MVVNLQTWVILLEFFGIGSQQPPTTTTTTSTDAPILDDDKTFEELSTRGECPLVNFLSIYILDFIILAKK